MSPLSFSPIFSHQRDRPCRTFPGRLCTACTQSRSSPSQHPSSSLGEKSEAHKTQPWACAGRLGWGHRAGYSLLSDGPSWWVAKLLSQWFPMKSLQQEVPHLGSLEKKKSSFAGNCFLKTAWPPGEAAEELPCVRCRRGFGSVEPGSQRS